MRTPIQMMPYAVPQQDKMPSPHVPLPTLLVRETTGLVPMATATQQVRVIREDYRVLVPRQARVRAVEDVRQEVV